ncbi:hypothetical protein TOTORO_01790 [Serratia phage vB_SmaS-Totoro]|nr:hypothetical protein TOTORO_01790 [Serratia phage vB_SmaS-Totoro]
MEKFLIAMGKAIVIRVATTLASRGTHFALNAFKNRKPKEKPSEQSSTELAP